MFLPVADLKNVLQFETIYIPDITKLRLTNLFRFSFQDERSRSTFVSWSTNHHPAAVHQLQGTTKEGHDFKVGSCLCSLHQIKGFLG